MKKIICSMIAAVAAFALVSCASAPKSSKASDVDLSGYTMVTLADPTDYSAAMDVIVLGALENTRLNVLGSAETMTSAEFATNELLLVKYGFIQAAGEATAVVTFIDALTLKPVAACYGTKTLGASGSTDMIKAMQEALKAAQILIKKTAPGYTEEVAAPEQSEEEADVAEEVSELTDAESAAAEETDAAVDTAAAE